MLRIACLACAATVLLAAAGVRAAETGVLRIGTPGDYAPYSWLDATTGTYRGADIALARALASRLGMRPQFVPTTWGSLADDGKARHFDIAVGGISITPERAAAFAFSGAYAHDQKAPVVRCGEERAYDTQGEINRPHVRLVVNRGGTNERYSREQFPSATLTLHDDNRTVFDEIVARRADVMVTDAVEGRLQARSGKGLCVAKVRARWAPASKAVLVVGTTERTRFDAVLRQLGGARRMQHELADWEGYAWFEQTQPAVLMAALIDERLGIVTEVARSKWNTDAAIADPPREQALLQSLRVRGAELNIAAADVDAFFGAQIEAAKVLQRELFTRWRRDKQGRFAQVADLARDIRPEIDRVTLRMLELLPQVGKSSRLPSASTMNLLSAAAVRTARAPLQPARELKARAASR